MNLLQLSAIGFVALLISALIVLTRGWHAGWTGDFERSGVQKMHTGSPPRIGAVPLIAAILLGCYLISTSGQPHSGAASSILGLLLVASIPAVLLGLLDDVTKKVPPRVRMTGAVAAGLLAIWLLDSRIGRVDVWGVDALMGFAPISVAITLLMVCGYTNAVNIVDGLNGLAGGLAVFMLAATAAVAYRFDDYLILDICWVVAAALVGFLVLNFPRGLLFLGDGGAYLIGFLLVQVWILLCGRHPTITPWFVAAMAVHPTMETIFSIFRRRILRSKRGAAMAPDRLHLHSLVYRRRVVQLLAGHAHRPWVANALASVWVALFAAVPTVLAIFFPTVVGWNVGIVVAAAAAYLLWFLRLVRFRRSFTSVVLQSVRRSSDNAVSPQST